MDFYTNIPMRPGPLALDIKNNTLNKGKNSLLLSFLYNSSKKLENLKSQEEC